MPARAAAWTRTAAPAVPDEAAPTIHSGHAPEWIPAEPGAAERQLHFTPPREHTMKIQTTIRAGEGSHLDPNG